MSSEAPWLMNVSTRRGVLVVVLVVRGRADVLPKSRAQVRKEVSMADRDPGVGELDACKRHDRRCSAKSLWQILDIYYSFTIHLV